SVLNEPVAVERGKAEPEIADGFARKLAGTEVFAGGFGSGIVQQAALVLLLGPVHDAEQPHPGLVLRRRRVIQLDARAVRQNDAGFLEADLLHFLHEGDDVAVLAAGPTAVALAARIDVERRARIAVERAKGFECWAGRFERNVTADHGDDVAVGL